MSQIFICPLSALDDTLRDSGARWMVSLAGPGKSPPRPPQIDKGFLALEFNDIAQARDGLIPPNKFHVSQLLEFFVEWNTQGALLIHCWMGISRSTAAALLACASLYPNRDMDVLAQQLRQEAPMATPNALLIHIGDVALGLDGRLRSAVEEIGRGDEAAQGMPFILDVNP